MNYSLRSTFIMFCIFLLILTTGANADEETSKKQDQEEEQTQTMETISYEVLLEGTYSGIREPLQRVITSNEEWEELWKKHVSAIVPQPPVPEVDFENFVGVAIFSGEKRTSGYQIRLKEVAPTGKDIVVRYKMVEPPANSFTLQVLTQPFILLKIPKPEGRVQLTTQ